MPLSLREFAVSRFGRQPLLSTAPVLGLPQVVAHRGDSQSEPEHTLAAYRRALEVGADGLECDVRLTADGHLVCVHDRRVDRTSSGTGLVSTLELTQLEGLDWGSWRQPSPGQGSGAAEVPEAVESGDRSRLLTLRRLLCLVADSPGAQLAIETKHPTRYGGLVERRLVELLARFGWARPDLTGPGPVRVMSFSFLALRRMWQLAPGLPLVYLATRMQPLLREGVLPRGVTAVGIRIDVLRARPDLPHRLHERGHQVHVWTVDDPVDVRRCLQAGVEAIITNRPRPVLHQLGR